MDAFLPRFVITAKEARAAIVAGRMHISSKRSRTAQSPAIGVNRIVARRGPLHDVHRFVVNGRAPELFLVMSLVSVWFIQARTAKSGAPLTGEEKDRYRSY